MDHTHAYTILESVMLRFHTGIVRFIALAFIDVLSQNRTEIVRKL